MRNVLSKFMNLRSPIAAHRLIFFSLLIACGTPAKNDLPYRVVRINASEYKYEMPDTIDAGYDLVRLVNTGGLWHEACIFKFKNDTSTMADYIDSVKNGIDYPACSEDV